MIKDVEGYFADCGQAHVFEYMNLLSEEERVDLLHQASNIDLQEVLNVKESYIAITKDSLSPPNFIALPEYSGDTKGREEARIIGEQAIRLGKVAAVTVAGGQGTRLGFLGPKGALPATPIKQKSLFQIFSEKLKSAQFRYGVVIPWFIMTSEQNYNATCRFFVKNNNFGLKEICFFKQEQLPAFDYSGKILMESPGRISLSPNGHGGIFQALAKNNAFKTMKKLGVEILSYFQVDNPLVNCVDPVFIGYHLINKSEMSSKMVRKISPDEKVGVFGKINDKLSVVEYIDMPKELTYAKDSNESLLYNAGNPAIHLLDRNFSERVGSDAAFKLPYHRAEKCVMALDSFGNSVKPKKPNAVKWEMFIFDALPMANNPTLFETAREVEFSPIKNAQGFASQQACINDQVLLYAHWLEAVGSIILRDDQGKPAILIEISPLFADTLEAFSEAWNALEDKPEIADNVYIE